MKTISTNHAPAAIGPYSQAVEAGNLMFTSGQIPLRPDGSFVDGDINEQIAQVLANLDAVLSEAGASRNDILKATIFMTDLAQFDVVNQAYGVWLGEHRPARSTIQVAALPKGAKVEIELIVQK